MNNPSKEYLVSLADKYEKPEFLEKDPSQFMHRFIPGDKLYYGKGTAVDAELIAFISANLAFGRRDQILSHIEQIISFIDEENLTPSEWIREGTFHEYFPSSEKSFYRMFTFNDMRIFFDVLRAVLLEEGSLGTFFEKKWNEAIKAVELKKNPESAERKSNPKQQAGTETEKIYLHSIIATSIPVECGVVAHSPSGAAKKLNMFLRWMVRDNSPVDLGLWKWYDKKNLLIPLDTHVMQQSVEFGFLEKTAAGKIPSASLKTAVSLSEKMAQFFPEDPVRADFALFGLGVNS